MKVKHLVIVILSVPLLTAFISVFGVTFSSLAYLILFISCPAVAFIVWYIYRDMEKKLRS